MERQLPRQCLRACAALALAFLIEAAPARAQVPPGLTVRVQSGYAVVTVTGAVGTVYAIQYANTLSATSDWAYLTNFVLTSSPSAFVDTTRPARGQRYYRALHEDTPTQLVWINPGSFTMGSPTNETDRTMTEGPLTRVTFTSGFWIAACETTQRDYLSVMGANPSHFRGSLSLPVDQVSWQDATNYCGRLTERERSLGRLPAGYRYRLPTEAEWEYACRAGTTNRFSHGNDPGYTNLTTYAWYLDNAGFQSHPVGQKTANPWGLFDMHGNVWEWCQDWYAASYAGGSVTNPPGPASGWARVLRGGAWSNDPRYCRSAYRLYDWPDGQSGGTGFRVVLAPE